MMAGSEAISVGIASRALRLQVGGDSTGSHVVYVVVYMEKRTSILEREAVDYQNYSC